MDDRTLKGWGTIFLLIMLFALGLGYLPVALTGAWPKTPNEFGDMFGFANALISAAAFAAVFLAIRMQSEELKLQRQELEATREELRRQAVAQETTGRLAFTANYLSAVATAVQHYDQGVNAPTTVFDGGSKRTRPGYEPTSTEAAERHLRELESLIIVLKPDVRASIPTASIAPRVQKVHDAVCWSVVTVIQAPHRANDAITDAMDAVREVVMHIEWTAESDQQRAELDTSRRLWSALKGLLTSGVDDGRIRAHEWWRLSSAYNSFADSFLPETVLYANNKELRETLQDFAITPPKPEEADGPNNG